MYKWKIVADSSCDLHEGFTCNAGVGFALAPLTIQIDGMSYVDLPGLDMKQMMDTLLQSTGKTSSACPSPDAWAQAFADGECAFGVTISGALSGSYAAAEIGKTLAQEINPNCKVHVFDTKSTSGGMVLVVHKLNELIGQGLPFEEIVTATEAYMKTLNILFTLSSFDNLVKNGRMNRFVGVIAKKLQMRIIGTTNEAGSIEVLRKCRGEQQTLTTMLKDMQELSGDTLSTRHVVISHCFNPKLATTLKHMLETQAPGVQCTILCTHALTSYYAENSGLIVGF